MKKFLSVLFFVYFLSSLSAFPEEVEVNSEIISLGSNSEFFIIRCGEDAGIEIGDGLIVHRDGVKTAEAYIIEVRPTVSAAEILKVVDDYDIQEGDSVLLVKKVRKGPPQTTDEYVAMPVVTEKGDIVSLKIYSEPKILFSYAALILRENNFSIISSNRGTGAILAARPIALSLIKELWADAVAAIDHNLVVALEIKGEGSFSTLTVSSFKEHSQKERHIKQPIAANSKYYNELVNLVSEIKERCEY